MTSKEKRILIILGLILLVLLCACVGVASTLGYVQRFLPGRATTSQVTAGTAAPETATPTVVETFTPAPAPTVTLTATPVLPPTATNTATRVVLGTSTPTVTGTPTETGTPTITPTYTRVIGAVPTSASPARFQVSASVSYTTTNHFFVMYAQIMEGGSLAAGYRLHATHHPSGLVYVSEPSCPDLCKGSGPDVVYEQCCNYLCTPESGEWISPPLIQRGNVALEAAIYETGSYSIVVVDDTGDTVSDVTVVPVDYNDRRWFFYVFSR